uniref:Uncharacterized protein n=1 Tax=Arundo donax TaxID=35708 RepID=A0A0A9C595_ARUDO
MKLSSSCYRYLKQNFLICLYSDCLLILD